MKKQFIIGYGLIALLTLWSLITGNYEFLIYAIITLVLMAIIHRTDIIFQFDGWVLWGFNLWMILHILGGLFPVGGSVLYSLVLIPIVDAPYDILKYDQIVHAYCYFIVALLMFRVVKKIACCNAPFATLAVVAVLAGTGIGGINEIVEFAAVVLVPDTNVGGYENTAIDIVSNMIGALLAVPLMKKMFHA